MDFLSIGSAPSRLFSNLLVVLLPLPLVGDVRIMVRRAPGIGTRQQLLYAYK